LIPEPNAKDLQEIPDNVKKGLEIIPVRWIDQVLEYALVSQPVALPEDISVPVTETTPVGGTNAVRGAVKH
jgi:ATP-dependent Lon protease